jgi:hypothetical protein
MTHSLVVFLPFLGSAILKLVSAFVDPQLMRAELSDLASQPKPASVTFQFDSPVREVIRRRLGYVAFCSTAAATSLLSLADAGLLLVEKPTAPLVAAYFAFFILIAVTFSWIITHKATFLAERTPHEIWCLVLLCSYDLLLGAGSLWSDIVNKASVS